MNRRHQLCANIVEKAINQKNVQLLVKCAKSAKRKITLPKYASQYCQSMKILKRKDRKCQGRKYIKLVYEF